MHPSLHLSSPPPSFHFFLPLPSTSSNPQILTLSPHPTSIQNFTTIAHVEEVSISSSHQKQGLGLLLIKALNALAMESLGVDKLILNCSEDNVGFYEKCGYERAGVQMRVERKK